MSANVEFKGRHYETGAIANVLQASGWNDPNTGQPYSESLIFGASGGVAFGYFVFEYKGHLPHVALLPRNTFDPFNRALDNMAIIRESKETTQNARAEDNLKKEIDLGNVPLVWADMFSMPHRGLDPKMMWIMMPYPVLAYEADRFLILDGAKKGIWIDAKDLDNARARVKKDRFRIMTLEAPDESRIDDRLVEAVKTCTALFLDKPPAGSADNFGIRAMRHMAKLLVDEKSPKGWAKSFEPGPRLTNALVGTIAQPSVFAWIELWGTADGADRGTFADFLNQLSLRLKKPELGEIGKQFEASRKLFVELAEASLPNEIAACRRVKELRRELRAEWFEQGTGSIDKRDELRAEHKQLVSTLSESKEFADAAPGIREAMSQKLMEIAEVEEPAVNQLRNALN